jgi:hypothetical protein
MPPGVLAGGQKPVPHLLPPAQRPLQGALHQPEPLEERLPRHHRRDPGGPHRLTHVVVLDASGLHKAVQLSRNSRTARPKSVSFEEGAPSPWVRKLGM